MTNYVGNTLLKLYSKKDIELHALLANIKTALQNLPETQMVSWEIIRNIKAAIELDSNEAIVLLAELIIGKRTNLSCEQQIRYVELAASYNYPNAVYYCGCFYGGLSSDYPTPANFKNLDSALSFLLKAINLNHSDALYTLVRGILDREPPHLLISAEKAQPIFENLINQGEIGVALYYGIALAGYHPSEFKVRPIFEKNYDKAIKYLLIAYNQNEDEKTKTRALEILKKGLVDKIWPSSYNSELKKIKALQMRDEEQSYLSVFKNILKRF